MAVVARQSDDVYLSATLTAPQDITLQPQHLVRSARSISVATITFDHTKVPSDRASLPILVSLTAGDLRTVANGGLVQNTSGYDILFYGDVLLTTKLNWELEKYNPATGEIEAWIRIPGLSASVDTVIFMAYGDSTVTSFQGNTVVVWSGIGATAVYHYLDGTTLSILDSTGTTTPTNHGATAVAGAIDGGANFDGVSQYIDTGADTPFGFEYNQPFTVTAVINPNITRSGALTSYAIVSKRDGLNVGWEMLITWDGVSKAIVRVNIMHSGSAFIQKSGTTDIPNGSQAWIGFSYNGNGLASGLLLYVSGVLESGATVGVDALASQSILNAQPLQIGARNAGAFFPGGIDEVRVSSLVRGADGLLVEYRNQSSPSTFYSTTIPAHVTLGSIALTVSPQAVTPTGAAATSLDAISLTVAPQAASAAGAGAQTLSTVALTVAPQTVTATGLGAVTTGTIAIAVAPQAVGESGAGAITLNSVALSVAPQPVATAGAAGTTLGAVALTVAPQTVTTSAAGSLTLSSLALSLAPQDVSSGGAGASTLDTVAMTVTPQAPSATGPAGTTLSSVALTIAPQPVTSTGAGATTLTSLPLTTTPYAVDTGVASPGNVTLDLIALTVAPQAVSTTGAGALTLTSISLITAPQALSAGGAGTATLTDISLTATLGAVNASGGGGVFLESIPLTVTTPDSAATGAGAVALDPIALLVDVRRLLFDRFNDLRAVAGQPLGRWHALSAIKGWNAGTINRAWAALAAVASWAAETMIAGWWAGTPFNGWQAGRNDQVKIQRGSTEYVRVPVSAEAAGVAVDPTSSTVELAFPVTGAVPADSDWTAGDWETDSTHPSKPIYYARLVVGPYTDKATYEVFVRITDSPEVPVLHAGKLEVL